MKTKSKKKMEFPLVKKQRESHSRKKDVQSTGGFDDTLKNIMITMATKKRM